MESTETVTEVDLSPQEKVIAVHKHETEQFSSVSCNKNTILNCKEVSSDGTKQLQEENCTEIPEKQFSHGDDQVIKQERKFSNVDNSQSPGAAVKCFQGEKSCTSSTQSTISSRNEQKDIEHESKRLTEQEIANKKNEILEDLNKTMLIISEVPFRHFDQDHAPFTMEFRQCILKLAKSYFIFKLGEVPYSVIYKFRTEIGEALSRNGIVKIMCDVLSDGLKRKDFINSDGKMLNEYWFPLKNILLTLLNFTDSNETIRVSVTNHTDVLVLLVQILNEWKDNHLSQGLSEDQNKMIKWSLSILHNCAGTDDNVTRLRDIEVIQVVLPYLNSKNENIRLSSISVLALLLNEEEAELLSAEVSVFQFMIRKLEKALKKEDHKDLGWSAAELTTAIGKLARNDANKRVLVDEGCLPLLVQLLRTGDEKEIKEAASCVWTLSFDKDNKKKMINEPGMVNTIYEKYLSSNGSCKHDCQGILWSLRDELLESQEYKHIGEEISNLKSRMIPTSQVISTSKLHKTVPATKKIQGHIMISYQWANQEIIKQICQVLRHNGFPVWIDIDYMGGCTLQAMAKAVEDSCAVIIAMSQKYKDSPNTRAEAEYTFQQRKPIIPLIMQKGYRPDGWLGLILGTKFYYDFSGKYTFESRMNALLTAVKAITKADCTNGGSEHKPISPSSKNLLIAAEPIIQSHTSSTVAHTPAHTPVPAIDERAIKMWTQDEITKWLTKYSLENTSLVYLRGEEIIFLHKLRHEAPEFFYHCLESKLHLESLLDLSRAAEALDDLTM